MGNKKVSENVIISKFAWFADNSVRRKWIHEFLQCCKRSVVSLFRINGTYLVILTAETGMRRNLYHVMVKYFSNDRNPTKRASSWDEDLESQRHLQRRRIHKGTLEEVKCCIVNFEEWFECLVDIIRLVCNTVIQLLVV